MARLASLVFALCSCHRPGAVSSPTSAQGPPESPAVDTGADLTHGTTTFTSDSGTLPSCPPFQGLEPNVVITPPDGYGLTQIRALTEDRMGLVSTRPYPRNQAVDPYPVDGYMILRLDDLDDGVYPLESVWDGVSLATDDPVYFLQVPDQDGDGVEDYWPTLDMVAGPLYGGLFDDNPVLASLATPNDGHAVLGGFDADGDGHDDILQMGGIGDRAFIR